MTPKIGILALQGDVEAHRQILGGLGVETTLVRLASDLKDIAGLVIPGGESTVMSRLCDRFGLWEPLQERLNAGLPALGTCAGLIFLAKTISGGAQTFSQKTLSILDVDVARNAYGTQLDSFETAIEAPIFAGGLHGVFIRAPRITRVGENVEILARRGEEAVAVRQGPVFGTAFHPEIAGESRLHEMWLKSVADSVIETGHE